MKPTKTIILAKNIHQYKKMWLENDEGERTANPPRLFDEYTENPWLVFQEGNLYFALYFHQTDFWKLVVRNNYGQVLATLYPSPQSAEIDKHAMLFKEEEKIQLQTSF